jgi:hypothetical protein
MKTILFYVSDHGFGHATRCISLTRQLQKNYNVIIKNHNAFKFLKNSLNNCKIFDLRTDVGPTYDWNLNSIDYKKTQLDFKQFIKKESSWIENEILFCKKTKPNLILSDISPMALRLSNKVNIPSISISNFSWSDILETFPKSNEPNNILHWLDESFSLSTLVLQLPLSMNLRGYLKKKNASLLTREITMNKNILIKKLGITKNVILSYSDQDIIFSDDILKNYDILEMKKNQLFVNSKQIHDFYEGQNLTSLASCVVSKIGYGVVSDCLRLRIPMLLLSRKNYPEDVVILKHLSHFNISLSHSKLEPKFNNTDINDVLSLQKLIKTTDIQKYEEGQSCVELIKNFLH